jgi:anti-anti-sigma factor
MEMTLSGEIDITTVPRVAAQLARRAADDGDLVVETTDLEFIDVAGCRALIEAAECLDDGGRLRLPDPAEPLLRVLRGCGWADHPRVELL